MNTVTIDGKEMYNTFGCILASKSISFPEIQTKYVEVPTRNGTIDLTNVLSDEPKYNDREITLTFLYLGNGKTAVETAIANAFHGKKLKIIFSDDASFYYLGRVSVDSVKTKKKADQIVLKATCEPFKHDLFASDEDWEWDSFDFEGGIINETASIEVNGSASYTLICRRGGECPTITASADMSFTCDGVTYFIQAGTSKVYEFILSEGENTITFKGNGTVSINYVGGSL